MVVIGIVGGIASGKTLVTGQFRQLGAEVVEADRLGHAVLEEPEVRQALVERWGDEVLDGQGRIDRKAVARRVFGSTPRAAGELAFLERMTHPRIGLRLCRIVNEWASRNVPVVVLDAPVLFEAGWDEFCDKIVFVETPRTVRQQRARQRGWTDDEFAAREAAQESLDEKRKRADWVIDNSGSPQDTFVQVQEFWRSLRQDLPPLGAPV
jgi:dephospho-CoA kinase